VSADSRELIVKDSSTDAMEPGKHPCRVIAWPAYKNKAVNPYNWLLYSHIAKRGDTDIEEFHARRLLAGRPDILHVHWPEHLLSKPERFEALTKIGLFATLVTAAKARGTRVVWTIHNLEPHESHFPRVERWYRPWLERHLDGVIALTATGAELAIDRFPALRDTPMAIIPHGHYMDVYPRGMDRSAARRELGLSEDQAVVLFVGQIRPYKGVPTLIEQFRLLGRTDARLVIAGRPNTAETRREVELAAAGDARIRLYLEHIADDRLQVFFGAADLVVLPYQEVLNSGTAILALSFLTPVLVPDRGAMAELQQRFGDSVVLTYRGVLTAEVLGRALDEQMGKSLDRSSLERSVERQLGWSTIADQTIAFFREVAS